MGTPRLARRNGRQRSKSLINLAFFFCNGGRNSPVTILTTLITCEIGCTAIRPSRSICSRTRIQLAEIRDASREAIPHIWWIHEGLVGDHFLKKYSMLPFILGLAQLIVTPDQFSRGIYQPFVRRPIRVLPYGIPDFGPEAASKPQQPGG